MVGQGGEEGPDFRRDVVQGHRAGDGRPGRRSGRRRVQEAPVGHQYRSIILARGGSFWVYQYLFAKHDRANIEDDELKAFRELAKGYAALTSEQVAALIVGKDWIEICTDVDLSKPEER
jgi:hypothetical protein